MPATLERLTHAPKGTHTPEHTRPRHDTRPRPERVTESQPIPPRGIDTPNPATSGLACNYRPPAPRLAALATTTSSVDLPAGAQHLVFTRHPRGVCPREGVEPYTGLRPDTDRKSVV